jgi:hypothetical protein
MVLTEQSGIVRQVVRGDRWAAWTRCLSPQGPTEVWARRFGTRALTRLDRLTATGSCEPQRLLGVAGDRLLAIVPGADGLRRVVAAGLPDGAQTVIDSETPGAAGVRIVAGDANGPRVVWIRDVGPVTDRVAEIVSGDLRRPGVTTIVRRQSLRGGVVRPVGAWVGGSGEIAWRNLLAGGAQYGYGTGQERVVLRLANGSTLTLSSVRGPAHVAGVDVGSTRAVYSVVRDDSTRVYIYGWDLVRREKRLLRVVNAAARPKARTSPDVPTPRLYADRAVWRERTRPSPSVFQDGVRSVILPIRRGSEVFRVRDPRTQRTFIGPPDLTRRVAVWPVVRFTGAVGWAGGFSGLSARPARTTIYAAGIR